MSNGRNDYTDALGELAAAAAQMEHSLHDAVIRCFPGREWMAHELIKELQASRLAQLVEAFFPESPRLAEAFGRIREALSFRNQVLHGLPAMYGIGHGKWTWHLESRRGKTARLPDADELRRVARDMSVLAAQVHEAGRLRSPDYVPEPPASWNPIRFAD